MIEPPAIRIPLPVEMPELPRAGFPLVATLAPLAVAGILFAVTGSPYMLLMAVLGPVIAGGSMLDGRRQRARARRAGVGHQATALEAVREQVREAHDAERQRLRSFATTTPVWMPAVGMASAWMTPLGMASGDGPLDLAIGRGDAPSGIVLGDGSRGMPSPELDALREEAARVAGASIVREVSGGIHVVGTGVVAVAAARLLALRLAARLSPISTILTAPVGESWARALPHEVRDGSEQRFSFAVDGRVVALGWGASEGGATPGAGVIVDAFSADTITAAGARQLAERLAQTAEARGIRSPSRALPEQVALSDLLTAAPAGPGLTAPLGRDDAGVFQLDLVTEGPHAVVAGTTGSGKSELLVSWVLGMASGRSADEVAFVLVDFKGGAAFAPLEKLPHVLGTLSDLDGRLAGRAMESLRAEVLRRERVLASAAARSIDELPAGTLARLVVVVDEFAAVVTDRPELHGLFADLAARGRSLGLHLILCTQRPAGIVRDAVLANVAVRIALRVSDRGDSIGLIGSDAAARLPVTPKGRAIVIDGAGQERLVQLAIAKPDDVARIAAATPTSVAFRPWTDPLPPVVWHDALPETTDGIPFGLRDLPAEQRQPVAVLEPSHGHLLVLGAPGSGATTTLESIAAGTQVAGTQVAGTQAAGTQGAARWLPSDPVGLWQVLTDPALTATGGVLLLDDLDLVLARCGADHAVELTDLVTRLLREAAQHGTRVVASARRLTGPLHALGPFFGSRLLLRLASREEHLLVGGDPASYDSRAPAGAGTWHGAAVQVARPSPATRHEVQVEPPARIRLPASGELAVVSTRPRALAGRWDSDVVRVRVIGEPADPGPVIATQQVVLLGDPDGWQSDWAELARARRDLPIVLHECGVSEHRSITRSREMPPPLNAGEVWLVEHGRTQRAVWD